MLGDSEFPTWFLNSTIVSAVTVAANLVFCSLAGYAFARLRFRGSTVLFLLILFTLVIPFEITMIPTFIIMDKLGIQNTLTALIVPSLVTPLGVFLMRQFFVNLPAEVEEAAQIDGCSRLGVLRHVALPLAVPALSTLAALTFLTTWNELLWPLIVISSDDKSTLPLGLTTFQGPAHPGPLGDHGGRRDHHLAGADRFLPARPAHVHPVAHLERGQGIGEAPMPGISIERLSKVYDGGVKAVDDISLEVADGEFMVLVGPSGAARRRRCG